MKKQIEVKNEILNGNNEVPQIETGMENAQTAQDMVQSSETDETEESTDESENAPQEPVQTPTAQRARYAPVKDNDGKAIRNTRDVPADAAGIQNTEKRARLAIEKSEFTDGSGQKSDPVSFAKSMRGRITKYGMNKGRHPQTLALVNKAIETANAAAKAAKDASTTAPATVETK